MCRQNISEFSDLLQVAPGLPETTRNYRKVMKPRLPRKITASARINLNRFWNELEEFYNRYESRPEKPVINLPYYTTDTFDHDREEAENKLNESRDQNSQVSLAQERQTMSQRLRFESADLDNDGLSSESETESECIEAEANSIEEQEDVFVWNVHEKSMPRPPKTLMDLIHRLAM